MDEYETPGNDVPSAPGAGGQGRGGNGNGAGGGGNGDPPGTVVATPEDEPAGRHYHYVADEILVVEDDVRLIEAAISQRRMQRIDVFRPERSGESAEGVVRFRLPPIDPRNPLPAEYRDVVATVTALRTPVPDPDAPSADALGTDGAPPTYVPRVFPHIVMNLSYHGRPHGARNRRRAEELTSPPRRRFLPLPGHGVKIGVIDTGFWTGRVDWYGNRVHFRPTDEESLGDDLTDISGHGTFIAGVIHGIAPGAEVRVRRFGDQDSIADRDLAEQLLALADEGVDIINCCIGGPGHDSIPSIYCEQALELLRRTYPGMVVVASAGNSNVSVPEYPAAFKGVVGVGALGPDKKRADFSNFGPWVDACAPGVDVHSTFVDWRPPHSAGAADESSFDGYARWSGTSFSTPAVAATIAVRRSPGGWRQFLWFLRPRNARLAADALLNDPGNTRLPGLGAVVKPVSYARQGP